ncbi:MAG: ADP-ribosylglycohydrolase family protein [Planctomycetota bacterium]
MTADEPSLRERLKPRFRGTLLGGAIGDALGFPFEGSSRFFVCALGDEAVQRFERHRSGYYAAGQYSDDTQMTLALANSIVEHGVVDGAKVAAAFVPLWRENRIVGRGGACSEAVQRLIDGSATWETSGAEEGRAGNGAAMRAAPLGLWNHDRPHELLHDVELTSRITHTDVRAVAGAAVVATSVSYNLTHHDVILGDFLDVVGQAAGHFSDGFAQSLQQLPRLLSLREEEAVAEIAKSGLDSAYRESSDGITPFVVPTVLIALYAFLRSPNDFEGALRCCLQAGGDVDTTASICGSISGALNGIDGLPPALVDGVVDGDQIVAVADAMYALKAAGRGRSSGTRG